MNASGQGIIILMMKKKKLKNIKKNENMHHYLFLIFKVDAKLNPKSNVNWGYYINMHAFQHTRHTAPTVCL